MKINQENTDYSTYEVEDFVEETRFIRWVLKPTADEDLFWRNVAIKQPLLREKINEAREYIFFFGVEEQGLSEDRKKLIWEQIRVQSALKKPFFRFSFSLVRYAATVLLIVGSVFVFYFFSEEKDPYNYSLDVSTATETKIILSEGIEASVSKNEVSVVQQKTGELVFDSDTLKKQPKTQTTSLEELSHIIVPFGKQSRIVLSDGTKVILNAGSKLSFPDQFKKGKRELYLIGEAFFEVASDKKHPFIVHTRNMDIVATGTRFNVNSYPENTESHTVLIEGVVDVEIKGALMKKSQLQPGEAAFFNADEKRFSVCEVNQERYVSWIKGYLLCEAEPIRILFQKMEKYYNQKIVCSPEVGQYYFSGKLDLRDDLEEVLKVISIATGIRIIKEDTQMTIFSK